MGNQGEKEQKTLSSSTIIVMCTNFQNAQEFHE